MLNQVVVVIPTVNECVCWKCVLTVVLKIVSCFKFIITFAILYIVLCTVLVMIWLSVTWKKKVTSFDEG